jgi:hypothetical protein
MHWQYRSMGLAFQINMQKPIEVHLIKTPEREASGNRHRDLRLFYFKSRPSREAPRKNKSMIPDY